MRMSLLVLTLSVLTTLGCRPTPPEVGPPAKAAPAAESIPRPQSPARDLPPDPPAPPPGTGIPPPGDPSDNDSRRSVKPSPLVQANTAFALDLYQQLRGRPGNLFFSPFSLSTALAMTAAGARGQTADEMARVLHFPNSPGPHTDFRALLSDLKERGKKGSYELSTANALWGQQGFGFLPEFLQLTRDHYGAGLREVDFRQAPEAARGQINAWAAQETRDKIKDLLSPASVTGDTRLVLANAIYFKGRWQEQFNKEFTRDAPFLVSASEKVSVPLMSHQRHFKHLDGETFQALDLPYVGGDLTMLILLPRAVDGLPALEKVLNAELLDRVARQMRSGEVHVSLPRFKVESSFQLPETLTSLGMPSAFDKDRADFSGMDGRRDLFVSDVVHKAFVDVNEEGTEAAAATGIVIAFNSLPPEFRADHPFLFLIRDTKTASILFLGRLVRPQG